ncbi:hypothetical protein FQZ97_723200 [compost metagenome]
MRESAPARSEPAGRVCRPRRPRPGSPGPPRACRCAPWPRPCARRCRRPVDRVCRPTPSAPACLAACSRRRPGCRLPRRRSGSSGASAVKWSARWRWRGCSRIGAAQSPIASPRPAAGSRFRGCGVPRSGCAWRSLRRRRCAGPPEARHPPTAPCWSGPARPWYSGRRSRARRPRSARRAVRAGRTPGARRCCSTPRAPGCPGLPG